MNFTVKLIAVFVAYVAFMYAVGYMLHLTGWFGEREEEGLELLKAVFFVIIFTSSYFIADWYKARKNKKG